jgi:hypothetical protein
MKRIREDGHLSKEEYDLQNSNSFFASSTSSKLSDHVRKFLSCMILIFIYILFLVGNSRYSGRKKNSDYSEK